MAVTANLDQFDQEKSKRNGGRADQTSK